MIIPSFLNMDRSNLGYILTYTKGVIYKKEFIIFYLSTQEEFTSIYNKTLIYFYFSFFLGRENEI
jgi:hypothetical protein